MLPWSFERSKRGELRRLRRSNTLSSLPHLSCNIIMIVVVKKLCPRIGHPIGSKAKLDGCGDTNDRYIFCFDRNEREQTCNNVNEKKEKNKNRAKRREKKIRRRNFDKSLGLWWKGVRHVSAGWKAVRKRYYLEYLEDWQGGVRFEGNGCSCSDGCFWLWWCCGRLGIANKFWSISLLHKKRRKEKVCDACIREVR